VQRSSAPELFLLAHSHGVSLLDALTDWRSKLDSSAPPDARYGPSFRGWFHGAIPPYPFETQVVGGALSLKRITAWLMSPAGGIGALVNPSASSTAASSIEADPQYVQIVSSWRGAVPIVSMINGNEHAATMLNEGPAYDFLEEEVAGIEPAAAVIDEAFIDERIDPWVAAVYFPLMVLRQLVANPLAHVLPPPPRENPRNSPYQELMGELIARHGFAPARLRLKWYRRYCRLLTARLAAIGCKVLPAPSQACSARGLLREDYAEGLTHGNNMYGMLTGQQIESWLRDLRA
jgi:hypothetical protein